MPRSSNQKLKPLYLMDFLMRNSDENHPVTLQQMIDHLSGYGISAERKSIYDDIEVLRQYGIDIMRSGGKSGGYYIASRTFELAELKLLVDSVQSSKFITEKKTLSLIAKIEALTSVHEGKLLGRQVYVKNRIKSMNESIYYNVDEIHNGIALDSRIRFKYFEYNVARERVFRKNGAWYEVSPYALAWDDENYYMIAFDSGAGIIKHYRVDKMANISLTNEPRDGQELFEGIDPAVYTRQVFGMFSGNSEPVRMRFANHLAGAVIDRFGRDAMLIPEDAEHFSVTAGVAVSPQFFAWICGFGTEAAITAPESVVSRMREYTRGIADMYS